MNLIPLSLMLFQQSFSHMKPSLVYDDLPQPPYITQTWEPPPTDLKLLTLMIMWDETL